MKKQGQEPAFSCVTGDKSNGYLQEGMSKRFYAACAAMQGILSNAAICDNSLTIQKIVSDSFEFADELLKQENE